MKGIAITEGLLLAKAADFATSLNIEEFKASNGWLGCWKGKYNVLNSSDGVDRARMSMN